jgi:hypothetical protein
VNLSARTSNCGCCIRKNVENLRVKVMDLPGSVVTEKMVQFGESPGDIRVPFAVNNIQMFACVGVVEPEVSRGICRMRVGKGELRKKQNQCKTTNAHRVIPLTLICVGNAELLSVQQRASRAP